MTASSFLGRLVARLDAAGVPHMIAGSFASTFHGVPRATHDIDIVIDPSRSALDALLRSFDENEYYADADVARDALARRSQFNIIDFATGWKADLILRKLRPFSEEEFRRREPAEIDGAPTYVATAEDSVIAKLEWAKLGDSERQLRDVQGILAVRGGSLDHAYIERWVAALGLEAEWDRARPKPAAVR